MRWASGCSSSSSPASILASTPSERIRCSSTVKWWYMLNCIIATMRPKSGTKRPSTPVSFMCRKTVSGAFCEVSSSRKRRLASGSTRTIGPRSASERVASRLASGWIARSCRSESQNNRIRLTGSRSKAASSRTSRRPVWMRKSSASRSGARKCCLKRRSQRSSTGGRLAWRASISAQTMAVRSPTSLAIRKYAFMNRSTAARPPRRRNPAARRCAAAARSPAAPRSAR